MTRRAHGTIVSGSELRVVDLSNPDAPALVATVDTGLPDLQHVAASGARVVAASRGDLVAIDVADKENPRVLGINSTPFGWSSAIAIDGRTAFVGTVDWSGFTYFLLEAFDVSGPDGPLGLGWVWDPEWVVPGLHPQLRLAARDNRIYFASAGCLWIVRFDPETYQLEPEGRAADGLLLDPSGLALFDRSAAISRGSEVRFFEISDPARPVAGDHVRLLAPTGHHVSWAWRGSASC